MFCPKCGKEVNDNNKFCDGCGYSFIAEGGEKPSKKPEKSMGLPKNILIIGVIIIVLLVGIIVTLFAVLKSQSNYNRVVVSSREDDDDDDDDDKKSEKTETEVYAPDYSDTGDALESAIDGAFTSSKGGYDTAVPAAPEAAVAAETAPAAEAVSEAAAPEETASALTTEVAATVEAPAAAEAAAPDVDYILEQYYAALSAICTNGILPDGTEIEMPNSYSSDSNYFAIADVDNDSVPEMVFQYNSSSAYAGLAEYVYKYDVSSKKMMLELIEFPGITYYKNGIVFALYSHNQGIGDTIWPYSVYKYNKSSKSYDYIASVDCWDKALMETDYSGNAFPDYVDTDRTGTVYRVCGNGYSGEFDMSLSDYNAFVNDIASNSNIVVPKFVELTQSNLSEVYNYR